MKSRSLKPAKRLSNSIFSKQTVFACASLFLTLSLAILPLFNFYTAQAAGTIDGFVFQDFNANGSHDTTATINNNGDTPITTVGAAIDQGLGGIVVTAYDAAGAVRGSAVTCSALNTPTTFCTGNNNGAYRISATGTGPYRVEFTNLPANFKPSAHNTDSVNGTTTATQSGSTVQFIQDGATANVNLALNVPEDYCQNNPEVASCNYSFGAQNAAPSNAVTALLSFPYSAGSTNKATTAAPANFDLPAPGSNPYLNVTANSVGTTFGLAYARSTRLLYAGAFFKRHSGFGPGANNANDGIADDDDDAGAIYVINRSTPGAVVNRFTVPGAPTPAHRKSATNNYQTDGDNVGWDAVGKTSLGGMAMSSDDSRLFVMNLENRTLYALNPTTGAALDSQAVPIRDLPTAGANCDERDVRPFAVTYYRGSVYVGMVCSAENSSTADVLANPADPYDAGEYYVDTNNNGAYDAGEPYQETGGTAGRDAGDPFTDTDGNGIYNQGDARQLTAYVYKVNPTTLDFDAAPAFRAPLNYKRGLTQINNTGTVTWQPWSNVYRNNNAFSINRPVNSQPMLTGITFDRGNLVLGLRDRLGDQIGHNTQSRPGSTDLLQPRTGGDTLRACVNATSGWDLEFNGRCGGVGSAQQNTRQGPGNAEYYFGDSYDYSNTFNQQGTVPREIIGKGGNHDDLSLGGVAQVPGAPDAMATVFDPIPNTPDQLHDGGVRWLNNTTGDFAKGYRIYNGDTAVQGTLGKANGIGDLELLCESAPIEVGNRVWVDADNDGVQDPQAAEAGRANVTVELYTGDLNGDGDIGDTGENALLGTTTTDANGEWYFNNSNVADGDTVTTGAQPGLKLNTNYIARIGTADFTGGAGAGDLANLKITQPNAAPLLTGETTAVNNTDSRDSDAVVTNGRAEILFNSSTAGSNNHTLDFGFAAPVSSIGSSIFIDRNNDGAQDADGLDNIAGNADDEAGISGVVVELLYDVNNNGDLLDAGESTAVATFTTFTGGNYYFSGLTAGNYQVRIPASNFTGAGALIGSPLSSRFTDIADNSQDGDDNGAQVSAGAVVTSPIISLQADVESITEPAAGGAQDDTLDNDGDMTVDFGFAPYVSIGSTVYLDRNNNGLQNPNGADNNAATTADNETGINGVLLQLLYDANNDGDVGDAGESTPVATTTTVTVAGLPGNYFFGNLPAGNYRVQIAAANFNAGSALAFAPTSSTVTATADNRVDGDDNGTRAGAVVISPIINLSSASEPVNAAETFGGNAQDDASGDASGDMTVDFGFVPNVSIGSSVFIDRNNDGVQDADGVDNIAGNADDETGINGVTVQLLYDANNDGDLLDAGESGVSDAIATFTTSGGNYYFGNLAAGNYQIRIPATLNFTGAGALVNFVLSSAVTDAADNREDADDNGAQTSAGAETLSPIISLQADLEPAGEPAAGGAQDDASGDTSGDMTVDFGFVPNLYSLGNRVWFDTNNNGQINTGEVGVNGVTVTLLNSDNSVYDSNPAVAGIQELTLTTANGGYYRFDNLPAGSYKVRVNASNFDRVGAVTNVLFGSRNTTGASSSDDDSNATLGGENGVDPTSYLGTNVASPRQAGVLSNVVTLGTGGSEPAGETDSGTGDAARPDILTDLTVDFGFYNLSLSGTVWIESDDDGILETGENLRRNNKVRLYNSAGAEIPVGPDGILGTADDANDSYFAGSNGNAAGVYTFGNLAPGNYRVRLTNLSTLRSSRAATSTSDTSADPNLNADNDDNGVALAGSPLVIESQLVTLAPGVVAGKLLNVVTNGTGTTNDPTVDFGLFRTSTAVTLQSFDATVYSDGVLLDWQTGYENSNIGFRVIRVQDGKREQINREIIEGSALVAGANAEVNSTFEYKWFDENGSANAVYYLEDVDINGKSSVSQVADQKFVQDKTAPRVNNAKLLGASNQVDGAQTEKFVYKVKVAAGKIAAGKMNSTLNSLANHEALKIRVAANGWHKVERNLMLANGLPENADLNTLQLFAENKEQAVRINQDGSIEFYGVGLDTNDTAERVYWLTWNQAAGKRINPTLVENDESAKAGGFASVVERRNRTLYIPSVLNGDLENFFGGYVWNNVLNQTVTLGKIAGGEASLEVDLQGFTQNNHRVWVKFNGETVGYAELDGTERKTFRFAVSSDSLREGANEVSLLEENGEGNISLLEALRVVYNKRTTAENGSLQFVQTANQPVLVDGFTSQAVRALDVTDSQNTVEMLFEAVKSDNGYAVQIPASAANRVLIVQDSNALNQVPAGISINESSNLRGFTDGADFVILSHKDFRSAANRLAAARRANGLSTVVVNVEDVYDEFNQGAVSTNSIQEFLRGAVENWKTKPKYLLFFGDASVDARNYLNFGANNFVPTKFVTTESAESSSDDALADFNNDGIAEIAVGRLPVRTAAQAETVVSKLLAFENAPVRNKSRGALFVADTGFENTTAELAGVLSNQMPVTTVNRQDGTNAEARASILANINNGARIVTFTGHGSQRQWTNGGLLKSDDAAALSNGTQLSLVVNLTCLTGSFASPNADSLSESLLNAENGGAWAVWASSGMTAEDQQKPMAAALFNNFGENNGMRLGDVLLKAKSTTENVDVRRTWTLFGDPTMRLR